MSVRADERARTDGDGRARGDILVVNVGSTSLKIARFARDGDAATARLSLAPTDPLPMEGPPPAVVLHRIVHGGEFTLPQRLTSAVLRELAQWSDDVPLHQPAALARVQEVATRWPAAEQFGVFDTAWHHTLAEAERVLPVPAAWRADGSRRFGFHGIAFAAACRELARAAPGLAKRRLVLAHLGGGSSVCGVLEGRSRSTSMGLTPLGGVLMATRAGSVDPGIVLRRLRRGDSLAQVTNALWRESGMKGIGGRDGDLRALLAASDADADAALAVEAYCASVSQAIAAAATVIGGLDAIVFSGGAGYHSAPVRRRIVARLGWLGATLRDTDVASGNALSGSDSTVLIHAFDVDEAAEMVSQWRSSATG